MFGSTNALGDAVREMRKHKHLSQDALAERIGVSKRRIIDIENKSGNPKFEILYLLVRELDLPLYQVFYPEKEWSFDVQNAIIKELSTCTDQEKQIIMSVVKCLRIALQEK